MSIDTTQILQSVNIVDVVNRVVPLTYKRSEYYGICPFHDDSKESLQVNERKQIFKCFACGAGGDAIQFHVLLGRTFHEACKELTELGIHKQIANRPLEWCGHIIVVVSATEWGNFFGLRCHKDAQPEFRVLATQMKELYTTNEPTKLNPGQWHLPFVNETEKYFKDEIGFEN